MISATWLTIITVVFAPISVHALIKLGSSFYQTWKKILIWKETNGKSNGKSRLGSDDKLLSVKEHRQHCEIVQKDRDIFILKQFKIMSNETNKGLEKVSGEVKEVRQDVALTREELSNLKGVITGQSE